MPKRRLTFLCSFVLSPVALVGACLSTEDAWLDPSYDLVCEPNVICRVNNEVILHRDIESRIDPTVLLRIHDFRRQAINENRWNADTRKQYRDLLMPDFARELRSMVKEKLILQEAKERNLEIDETELQRRLESPMQRLRSVDAWIKPDVKGARAFLRKEMLLQAFRDSLLASTELADRPRGEEAAKRNEKEWFLAALKRSQILDGNSKPIPLPFFFPDDPTIVDGSGLSEQNTDTSGKRSPSKER